MLLLNSQKLPHPTVNPLAEPSSAWTPPHEFLHSTTKLLSFMANTRIAYALFTIESLF
jgi:hypothetical protein